MDLVQDSHRSPFQKDGLDQTHAPDVGAARCFVEWAPARVECPEHGVRAVVPP